MTEQDQAIAVSEKCPTGGKEVEELYHTARKFQYGAKGFPRDLAKAESLYTEAIRKGSAKAAINLGFMYRIEYFSRPDRWKRLQYMVALFEHARSMGCPDGSLALASAYEEGYGVKRDKKTCLALIRESALGGSPAGMMCHGDELIHKGLYREGEEWLKRSLAAGNGDAGERLADHYALNLHDAKGWVESLREGARLGSMRCIVQLELTYHQGWFGQKKDRKYAECFTKLYDSLDPFDPPAPVKDFDRLCPPRAIQPFRLCMQSSD